MRFYEVGGCVRDELLGWDPKDIDFAVEVDADFTQLVDHLVGTGFKIHQIREEFVTVRAGVPEDHPLRHRVRDADFVMCRRDGIYSDGRRPDFVEPGTLREDLARRDFTINAMAKNDAGDIIDPFGGQNDLNASTLRFVGDPMSRIVEDGLRVARGLRFIVLLDLEPAISTWEALTSEAAAVALSRVAKERIADELNKMLVRTPESLDLIAKLPDHLKAALFPTGLRLTTTMKEK